MAWTPLLPVEALTRPRALKVDGVAILLLPTESGPRACAAACPHEGYPLITGGVSGDVLTCRWHNFKFNLCDGAALIGEEALEVFPLRVVDGQIEIDPHPADPAAAQARRWAGLEAAMVNNETGRIAREAGRLLQMGVDPVRIALFAARHDALRAEWGTQHALPVAADLLPLLPRYPGVEALQPLIQVLDLAAESNLRLPVRARPPALDPGPDLVAAGLRCAAAVEAEDAALAEGLLRGAWEAGAPFEALRPWLEEAVTAHFLDFGHAILYLHKLPALVEAALPQPDGRALLGDLLGALVFRVVGGTREDTLPFAAAWGKRIAAGGPIDPEPAVGLDALEAALLDGGVEEAAAAFLAARGHGLDAVARVLVRVGARQLLRYRLAIEHDLSVQDSFLSVSHRLTVPAAARALVERLPPTQAWRLLAMVARFVHDASPAAGPEPLPAAPANAPDATLLELCRAQRAEAAEGLLLHLWATDRAALAAQLEAASLGDLMAVPIFVAHHIKTSRVAFEEAERLEDPLPLRALLRWMSAPRQERRAGLRAAEAIRLLKTGHPPRVLAP
jgi:nitrite reductase/ring-hydroxylating ferredoxin subunit